MQNAKLQDLTPIFNTALLDEVIEKKKRTGRSQALCDSENSDSY
jgi:hypothetical protein